jgi:hypothetical protein
MVRLKHRLQRESAIANLDGVPRFAIQWEDPHVGHYVTFDASATDNTKRSDSMGPGRNSA